jgi:CRISPR-associated protein Cmr6
MSGYNNSLLYYKHYYADSSIVWEERTEDDKKRNKAAFKRQNDKLYGADFPSENLFSYSAGLSCITLRTTYPGLLLGSGIAHGSGLLGEMKLGFFLDYTTGLPVIAGSSVKGVLRSAFPEGYRKAAAKGKKSAEEKVLLKEKAAQITAYLQYRLKEITEKDWSSAEIEALETFLFGSYETGQSDTLMSGRPVFHDAIPLNADRVSINGKNTKNYLGDDYITPHNKEKGNIPAALRNPIPIAFLKVLPGVVFGFQFVLFDFNPKAGDFKLTKKQIEQLFRHILLDFGIGAKTNTGYGRLEDPNEAPLPASPRQQTTHTHRSQTSAGGNRPQANPAKPADAKPEARFFKGTLTHAKDLLIDAVVTVPGRPNKVQLYIAPDNKPEVQMTGYNSPLEPNQIVETYVRLKKNHDIESVRFKSFKK